MKIEIHNKSFVQEKKTRDALDYIYSFVQFSKPQ